MFVILWQRLSRRKRHSEYDLAIADWHAAGLNVASYARVHKLTVLSKAEVVRSLAQVSDETAIHS